MPPALQITTQSIDQTLALGRLLGQLAPPSSFLALDGQLGAGKTHLTRGIAMGANVNDPTLVSSPTYVLLNIYEGPKPVYHLDAYRLTSAADFQTVGLDELLSSEGITILEWANKFPDALPPDRLHVQIDHADNPDLPHRTFTFTPMGPVSGEWLTRLQSAWPA